MRISDKALWLTAGGAALLMGWLDAPAWVAIVTAGLAGYSGLQDHLPVHPKQRAQVVTMVGRRMASVLGAFFFGLLSRLIFVSLAATT